MDKSETEQVLSDDKDMNQRRDDYEDEMYEEFDEADFKKDSVFEQKKVTSVKDQVKQTVAETKSKVTQQKQKPSV